MNESLLSFGFGTAGPDRLVRVFDNILDGYISAVAHRFNKGDAACLQKKRGLTCIDYVLGFTLDPQFRPG